MRLRMRTVPPSTLLESPWRMLFSTSGCSSMLGTSMIQRAGSISFTTRSFSPKRTISMAR